MLGTDPAGAPDALRARIGVMPQGGGAYPGVRAAEMLRLVAACSAHPLDPAWLLDVLGLTGCARTPYKRLSGGQQQRLALACAVVGRPELVFLDEPTAGLDPQARRLVWELVDALRRDGVAVLLTTHLMEEAEALADDVVIVDHGRVVAHGSPAALTSTGPQQELRFRAKPGMDLTGLATALPPEYRAAETDRGPLPRAGADRPRRCCRRSPRGARSRAPSPTTSRWPGAASRTCSSSSPDGSCARDRRPASRPARSPRPPARAARSRMLAAQSGVELRLALRGGEQVLLTLLIPVVLLVGLTLVTLVPLPDPRVAAVTPGVLALAVMSTAFTGQAIALGFDRRYGVIRRLAATALPRWLLVAGRLVAVLGVVVVQVVVLDGDRARPGLAARRRRRSAGRCSAAAGLRRVRRTGDPRRRHAARGGHARPSPTSSGWCWCWSGGSWCRSTRCRTRSRAVADWLPTAALADGLRDGLSPPARPHRPAVLVLRRLGGRCRAASPSAWSAGADGAQADFAQAAASSPTVEPVRRPHDVGEVAPGAHGRRPPSISPWPWSTVRKSVSFHGKLSMENCRRMKPAGRKHRCS